MWDEGNGYRGVSELGSCVLSYLKETTSKMMQIINCAGQQKNKYILAIDLYAVKYLGIRSIYHKFLIKGHVHNEGDSAYSLIEQQMYRSGPKYFPEYFISAIRSAKMKGPPLSCNRTLI
ncbi:hypothetical protein PR048_013274 [Dryococelus australis]|uniref:DUF7869 domain-containing protein n=1 Tax=Dryococelus australis TaxID=614101 RepID=A0ABQ9HRP8_9NEOP|nr:hypothetical protein PR048_013274 [Dryococelus australis]